VEQRSTISSEPSYLEYCTMKELNSFAQFQKQIALKHVKKNEGLPLFENRVCMFGHAFEPFAKVINTDNLVVISDSQSLMHSFYQFTSNPSPTQPSSRSTRSTASSWAASIPTSQKSPIKPTASASSIIRSNLWNL
jgi:hypothetical protein